MLKQRLITGPLLIALLLGLVILDDYFDSVPLRGFWSDLFAKRETPPGGIVLFFLTALVVSPLAGYELNRIFQADGIATRNWLTTFAAVFGLVLSYAVPMSYEATDAVAIISTGVIFVFVLAVFTFSRRRTTVGVVAAAGAVVFSMVYLGLLMGFFLALRRNHSAWWIVGIVLITKSCDIGAFFTGNAIGKHKMIPWLSPGKTWEGLAGGIVTAVLVGVGCAAASMMLENPNDHIPLRLGAVCGAVFAIVGQFGDLTMSLFKRGAGLKDSSSILPGMGGVLDVLDSPLLVAPVAYWILTLAA